jgi:hypothetical protein
MRSSALRLLLAAAALLALGVPASASALSLPLPPGLSPEVRALVESRADTGNADPSRKSLTHQFTLRATRGYSVLVVAEGNSVLVEVGRKGDHALTAYAVKGKVTRNLVQADLGALGSISMRFHRSRARGAVQRREFCRGVPEVIRRHGHYTGAVRLRGEGNYFSVGAHRAKGRLEAEGVSKCFDFDDLFSRSARASSSRAKHEGDGRPRTFFASWREGGSSVLFGAMSRRRGTQFVALSEQSLGRMAIFHLAVAKAPSRVFALDDAITSAKLSARKPFRGAGIYTAAPDGSTTWEGSMSVDFPGAPGFPLTGPQFEVELDAGF